MKECWASSLGDCGSEFSREHIVSAALWPGARLLVTGFDWCHGQWKEVGVNSFVSHVLCKGHNNALSDLDTAAGAAFDQLRRAIVLVNERLNDQPPWPLQVLRINDARLIERWFLKTMLNIVVVKPGSLLWRRSGATAAEVPEQLVRIAFGKEHFSPPLGLYMNAPVGQKVKLSESITFAPLLYNGPYIVAGLFGLAGWQFLLHLEPYDLPRDLVLPSALGGPQLAGLHYRLKEIVNRIGPAVSHTISFDWS